MDYFGNTTPSSNVTPLPHTTTNNNLIEVDNLGSIFSPSSQTCPVENIHVTTPTNFQPLFNPNFSFLSQPLLLININVDVNSDTSDDDSDDYIDENSDSKKPRGRPQGSKNKPKRVILEPFVIHVCPGGDIVNTVVKFASVHNFCVSIICGHGHVTELDACYPGSTNVEQRKITGSFRLVSCTGYFTKNHASCFCKVSIADSEGKVVNEIMVQRLTAKNQVQLVGSHR